MAKKHKPEEIIGKLREAEVVLARRTPFLMCYGARSAAPRHIPTSCIST